MDDSQRIALLIDGDNISPKHLPAIMIELQKRGTCSVKRIYGDWTTVNMNGWKPYLQQFCIRPMQQFRYGENATDGAIIMDAMEILLSSNRIDTFCIVSSDSDYYNLCHRIRESGRTVIGIGERKTKQILQLACDEFIFLDNLEIKEEAPSENISNGITNPEKLLIRAYSECSSERDWISFARLGGIAKNIYPSFDPRSYNHPSFRSLVESLEIFEVKGDNCMPPNYFCRIKEVHKESSERRKGQIKRFGPTYFGFIKCDDGDYFFTKANIRKDQQNIEIVAGMQVMFDILKAPNPSGSKTYEKNGRAGNVEFLDQPNIIGTELDQAIGKK
jgi:hypothetical protein